MSFKRPLSLSPLSKKPRKSIQIGVCQVCGDKASIINYGALSCASCKTFFRRNGLRPENARPCEFSNSCEVNLDTRRCCAVCRLTKCFSVGMNSDLIRKEEERKTKSSSTSPSNSTEHVQSKQELSVVQLPRSSERRKRQSLNNSQWTLIANIVHAYDTFSTTAQISQLIERLTTSPIEMHLNETNELKIIALVYGSMRSFISSLPNFQALPARERFSLFQRNLPAIAVLAFIFIVSDLVRENDIQYPNLFTIICGSDMLNQAKRIDKQVLNDWTTIKLFLIVLAFSSNSSLVDVENDKLNDGFFRRSLENQNIYIELLWKYMIHRCGYSDSARRFSRLMELFLNLIKYSSIAYEENAVYQQLVHNLLQETKQIRLWEK